jgi:hypothetical protein
MCFSTRVQAKDLGWSPTITPIISFASATTSENFQHHYNHCSI